MPAISPEVADLRAEMVALRRELHAHPELAFQETRTAARVVEYLQGSGLDVRSGVGRTGVVATAGGGAGPTLLLRVDLDGLPIQEQNEVPYASRTPGVMHACGHDGHVAMGATAARVLARRRLGGTVRLLFQPAEEGEGGARSVIEAGVLDGADLAIGIHLWNEQPVGTIGVKAGPLMAAVDRLERVPGCYVFVGSANPARGLAHPHHSPLFDFDEEALPIGCEFLVRVAEEALKTSS